MRVRFAPPRVSRLQDSYAIGGGASSSGRLRPVQAACVKFRSRASSPGRLRPVQADRVDVEEMSKKTKLRSAVCGF